jgi:hypothetical protein
MGKLYSAVGESRSGWKTVAPRSIGEFMKLIDITGGRWFERVRSLEVTLMPCHTPFQISANISAAAAALAS